MSVTICARGEIGPFPVWEDQNAASSCDPGRVNCRFKDVCLEARYEGGVLFTKHFEIRGPRVSENSVWETKNPRVTTGSFDVRLAGHTLEGLIARLSALHVYRDIEKMFIRRPIRMDVSNIEEANAGFLPSAYSFMFGAIKGLCNFASDMNVLVHEFAHLLTYTNNRELGGGFDDMEGFAMHEAISDATDALLNKDPEIGEGVAVCLGYGREESPALGIRRVDVTQASLFYDEEAHGRAELYAPFIWFSYIELAKLMGGDRDKASELMLMLTSNMAKFIPANPKKLDFVKAFYNALDSAMNDSEGSKGKYAFSVPKFIDAFIGEAYYRRMLEDEAEIRKAIVRYEKIPASSVASKVRSFMRGPITFSSRPLYENDDVAFYQEYYDGLPVDGAGIRFVKVNDSSVKVVPMIVEDLSPTVVRTDALAWESVRSADTVEKFRRLVEPRIRRGELRDGEVRYVFDELRKTRDGGGERPVAEKVYLSGKKNVQYKFVLNGITCYVDSVTGEVSFHRQRFHAF